MYLQKKMNIIFINKPKLFRLWACLTLARSSNADIHHVFVDTILSEVGASQN